VIILQVELQEWTTTQRTNMIMKAMIYSRNQVEFQVDSEDVDHFHSVLVKGLFVC